jgi:hypothetical protein
MATANPAQSLFVRSSARLSADKDGLLRRSFRLRLTVLVTALIAGVLVLLIWAANRGLDRIVLQSGQERAQGAATQLAAMLAQSTTRSLLDMQRLATDSAIGDYLTTPTEHGRNLVTDRLKALAVAAQPPVELLNATGEQILEISAPNATSRPLPISRQWDRVRGCRRPASCATR